MTETKQKKHLTPRQQRFCEYYPWASSGTEAAKQAGYAEKDARQQASRLLTLPYIEAEITRQREIGAEKAKITPEEVINRIKRDIDGAREAGNWTSVMKGNDMLGRRLGMWKDSLEIKPQDDSDLRQNFAALALSGANGDRVLARRIFRGFMQRIGTKDVFGPPIGDGDIDTLLDGAAVH